MSHTSLRNQKLNRNSPIFLPPSLMTCTHLYPYLCSPSGITMVGVSPTKAKNSQGLGFQISISSPDRPTPLTFYLISQPRCLTDIPQIQPFPSTSTLCSFSLLNSRTLTGQFASILIPRQQGVVFKKHQSAYSSAYCSVASPPSSGLEPNTLPWPTKPEGTGPLQGSVLISSPPPDSLPVNTTLSFLSFKQVGPRQELGRGRKDAWGTFQEALTLRVLECLLQFAPSVPRPAGLIPV